jgi:barstar (barnase inhibitor)
MTTSPSAGIWFVEDFADVDATDARVVRIPAGLLHKRDLLTVLARDLDFPGYFGWNWDALEECLRDLKWIEYPRRILLIHDGLPFQPDWDNRATYLSIIKNAVAAWGPTQPHELIAVFRERDRDQVLREPSFTP